MENIKVIFGTENEQTILDVKKYICSMRKERCLVEFLGVYKVDYVEEKAKKYSLGLAKTRNDCIKQLYFLWCEENTIKLNKNEGWFKSEKFREYKKEIGFIDMNFNFVAILKVTSLNE